MERKLRCTLIVGLGCLMLFSCKSKEQKVTELKEKIIPVIDSDLIHKYSVKIDSIKIFKIDTISDFIYNKLRTNTLYNVLNKYENKQNYYFGRAKDLAYQAREAYNNAHMELYTPDENEFRREQMDRYNQKLDEEKDYQKTMQKYGDTLQIIANEIEKLEKQRKTNKLNKNNFLGYAVLCHFVGADIDNSQLNIDTMGYFISPTLRIMKFDRL